MALDHLGERGKTDATQEKPFEKKVKRKKTVKRKAKEIKAKDMFRVFLDLGSGNEWDLFWWVVSSTLPWFVRTNPLKIPKKCPVYFISLKLGFAQEA